MSNDGNFQDLSHSVKYSGLSFYDAWKKLLIQTFIGIPEQQEKSEFAIHDEDEITAEESIFNNIVPPDDQPEFLKRSSGVYNRISQEDFDPEIGVSWEEMEAERLQDTEAVFPYLAELLAHKMPKNTNATEWITRQAQTLNVKPEELAGAILRLNVCY